METWRRVLRERCLTILYRTNVSPHESITVMQNDYSRSLEQAWIIAYCSSSFSAVPVADIKAVVTGKDCPHMKEKGALKQNKVSVCVCVLQEAWLHLCPWGYCVLYSCRFVTTEWTDGFQLLSDLTSGYLALKWREHHALRWIHLFLHPPSHESRRLTHKRQI